MAALCSVGPQHAVAAIEFDVTRVYVNPIPGDSISSGTSIAAVGNNVVVGVGYHDIAHEDDGAVYLFDRKTGTLQRTYFNPDPHVGDRFGEAVVPMGNNILIGAPSSAYAPVPTPGVAYLFNSSGQKLQTFLNPTPDVADGFGFSIAATNDTVAISAPNDDTRATEHGNSGAVYLFDAEGTLQHVLFSPTPSGGDYFGSAVAAVGNDILVGAGGSDKAAYLFDTSGNLLRTFENPGEIGDGHFGQSLGPLGDDVLIDALDGEHAYLFDGETGELLQTFFNPLPGETFGHGIAGHGQRVFVGAPSLTMHLFDACSGDLLYTFDNPGGKIGAPIVIMGNGVLTGGGEKTYLFTVIPEPTSKMIWCLVGLTFVAVYYRRHRRRGLARALCCDIN
jgi:WD40 repeat protein